MMLRDALWPSEGDTDGILHAAPTDCPLGEFSVQVADECVSVAAAWNKRALSPDLTEVAYLREALRAAKGYLMNAQIDLETGARKVTTLMTIAGGLKMIEAALVHPADRPVPLQERGWQPFPVTTDQEVEVRGVLKTRGDGVHFTHWRPVVAEHGTEGKS